ncbi:MAG: glycosyltransferase family 4 protein [Kocuria sp.]|nr:glycosyltransferase family 4 protein [Kocuria sp.]
MSQHKIGYVLKVYPRFSETFIVTEILAREAHGEQIEIFALRHSTDPRFHPELARVKAPLTYIRRPFTAVEAWGVIARAQQLIPNFGQRFAEILPDLVTSSASDIYQGIELACSVVENQITYLHCHFANISVDVAEIASRLTGVPFCVTTHAKDLFHESVSHERLEHVFRHAHHVLTISEYNHQFLVRNFPQVEPKLHRVYNGLELARFPYAVQPVPTDPLHIVAVGRLVEKKGFDVLIRAAATAHANGLDLKVTIAGGGHLEEPLRQLTEELGMDDRIEFLGPRTQAEVRDVLRGADLFAAPCVVGADGNADGLPTVLLEAMAMGIPVVATRVTGIPEVVNNGSHTHNRTGILLEPGDVDSLAQAFATVADPHWDRAAVSQAARDRVEADFDSRVQARRLSSLVPTTPPTSTVTSLDQQETGGN